MKLNLFLSVLLVFTVFNLCKAGPLRHLQKRAVFYIANETACVVDNIVYTNGDPIPTDDPCEACRCRPPGFACVLKECKIKPGCRAVRHVGQCCPEYICGCEHDGRFYQDGEAILDPKNPCYECYCQGSSIACAFIDCIYRDECDSVFVPGECCPQYTNCTGDIPDRNLFLEGNVFPPINLMPTLNDESVLADVSSSGETIVLPENPLNPIQPEEPKDSAETALFTESSQSDVSGKTETPEPEIVVTEAKNLNEKVEEKDTDSLESIENEKQDLPKENEEEKVVEPTEETKILPTSESDASKDSFTESLAAQESDIKLQTEPEVPEVEKEFSQPTEESKLEEITKNAEVTEKLSETELTTPEITEKEPQIRNSENSKSLKLSDMDQLEEIEKQKQNVKPDSKTNVDTTTELVPESTSAMPTVLWRLKESSTVENKPQTEKAAEESQTNSQNTTFYINNPKIKSESAETVTIVVHVKEGEKLSTETDFIAETVTPTLVSNVSEENLMKSNDEIRSTSSTTETSVSEDNKSTNANYEIFPTTMKVSNIETSSKPQLTDQNSDNIQERSDEADNIALEAEEKSVSEGQVFDSKNENDSLVTTTTMGVAEVSKEARTSEEVTEETKLDEPTATVIRIDTSRPITIEIITDSISSPKPEKSTTESESIKIDESTEQESKNEKIEETASEVREDPAKAEEKTEETTSSQSEETTKMAQQSTEMEKTESTTVKEASMSEEKEQESAPTNTSDNLEMKSNDEIEKQKNEEKKNTENGKVEENKSEGMVTESENQGTKESQQTTSSIVNQ